MSILFLPPQSAGSVTIADATETTSGKIRIATSAEATAGTNDVTAMTPAKVKSVVDASLVGGVTYQGTLDASAPADLSNATKGDLYIISVAGTYAGKTWAVGDHLLVNADMGGTLDSSKIDKVDNTDAVTSVAGRTGAVTLSTADISGLATVASTGAYSDLSGTPTLATVATTGAYSDLSGTPTLGTASAEDVGTSAGNVVQLDGSARLPAVDGSQLTNLPSGASALDDLTDVTITAASTGEVLRYDGAEWVDAQLAYSDLSGTPTLGTAAAEDVGTSAGNVVQLDGSARLPAVDGSQLTNLPGGDAFYLSVVSSTSTATAISDNRRQNYDVLNGGVTLTIPQGGTSDVVGGVVSVRNSSTSSITFGGTTGVGPVFKTALNTNVYTMTIAPGETRSFVWTGTNALKEFSVSQLGMLGDVNITAASTGEVLRYDGAEWVDAQLAYSDLSGTPTLATVATTGAYSDLSGTPTLGTAAALDVGTSANNVVQLNGSAQLPAVDGSLLTGITAGASAPSVTSDTPASTYTISTSSGIEEIYLLTPSVDCTVSIPSASTAGSGYKYYIKNLSTNVLTVNATIDGTSGFNLSAQYGAVTLVSDGTNWFII